MEHKGCELIAICDLDLTDYIDLEFSLSFYFQIDRERNGCESIGYWTHYVTLNVELAHLCFRNGWFVRFGTKRKRYQWAA